MLLRPKTGLKDMYLALDPGTKSAGALPEGGSVSVANTLPDVNTDEFLAELDSDTRAYVQILLNAGGTAFDDQITGADKTYSQSAAQDLRETFKRFEPTARDGKRITRLLIARRQNLRRVIHNFQELSTSLGQRDRQLASLVDSANANFQALRRSRTPCARRSGSSRARSTRPSRRSRRRARWPGSSARRSSACARSPASWRRRCGRRSPSSGRRRRSSATRSARSRATSSRPCATCARPPTTSRS